MVKDILKLNDFLSLHQEQQIKQYLELKMKFKISDICKAWDMESTGKVYVLLKKLNIYEQCVRKSDKFMGLLNNSHFQSRGNMENYYKQNNKVKDDNRSLSNQLKEHEKALLRVVLATYQNCVSNRLNRDIHNNSLESTARDAVYAAIKVDISKIEYNGNADTVLWERLLDLYNEITGEKRAVLV